MSQASGQEKKEKPMKWWQLSLLGVAFTIGTGYFLGSGIAIQMGGASVLIAFILAAVATYMVFDMLSKMTADEPMKGSFRTYAKKAYGRWAGFSSGWVYWSSELLIMGSQLTALSLFSRFWFPGVPLWIFAGLYAILGLIIILTGTKGFERLEHLFAVIKIAAIVMFLLIAAAALIGWIDGGIYHPKVPVTRNGFLPNGVTGLWASLIFAFYAFGGIEIMGIVALRLREPKQAPKAGKVMLFLLTTVYVLSVGMAVTLIPLGAFQPKKSPFVTVLDQYDLPFVPHIFNGVFIIAGFSTMVASLYAITSMLVTLAEDNDAPDLFAKKWKRKLPIFAIGLTTAGLIASIIMALLLPERLYEYVTTAASLLLIYNWLFILVTSGKLLKLTVWGHAKRIIGMVLILVAIAGTLTHGTSRTGFYVSLLFICVIGTATLVMRAVWKKQPKGTKQEAVVERIQPFMPKKALKVPLAELFRKRIK